MHPHPIQYSPFAKQSQYSFRQKVFLHLHEYFFPWIPEFWSNIGKRVDTEVAVGSEFMKGESMSIGIPGERCAVNGDRDFKQNWENGEISGLLLGSIIYFDKEK
jgi:hypothetical protein